MTFEPARTAATNCPSCKFPRAPGAHACGNCGTLFVEPGIAPAPTVSDAGDSRLSRRDRLGAIALDLGIWLLTAGLGWLVWTLIVAKRRQSPAKILLHHKVVNPSTGYPSTITKYLVRTGVTFIELFYLVAGMIWGFGVLVDVGGYWVNTFILPIFFVAVIAADFLWLILPGQTRLLDRALGTQVIREAQFEPYGAERTTN